MSPKNSPSTVEKALRLLLAMSEDQREVGTTELGRKLGIHKATVSRILLKLAEYEFVYKNKETSKYWLGPAIHKLAMTIADVGFNKVMRIAQPHINELRDDTDETVALEIWLGNSTVPTYSALSRHALKATPPPGEPLALHAAAGAKAILSFTHADRVDVLLKDELSRITDHTITDKDVLKEQLVEFHKLGYAVDKEEFHVGICAIAAPIFGLSSQPIAALVILIPSSRSEKLSDERLISQLKRKARLITNGYAQDDSEKPS